MINTSMTIMRVEGGPHLFVTGAGDLDDVPLQTVTMKLTGRVGTMDQSLPSMGYGLMAAGAIAFLFGGRRRKRVASSPQPQGRIGRASDIGRARPLDAPVPEPAPRTEPEKPQRKWGRDGS